ncbi:MAG TPA: hypothetical protein VM580_20740 [Labilithrix sp.]|jgi:hypothetical protein|nr:hypothetical protein [Labilithrix sp.]
MRDDNRKSSWPKLASAALSLESHVESSRIAVTMRGNADMESLRSLEAFLGELHDEAVGLRCRQVTIDMRELYFMNSASIKLVVAWIANVQALSPTARYSIHLASNPNLSWQRWTLNALKSVAADLITVD